MKKQPKKVKRVKAWAIIDVESKDIRLHAVLPDMSAAEDQKQNYMFPVLIVPVTITYQIPNPKHHE